MVEAFALPKHIVDILGHHHMHLTQVFVELVNIPLCARVHVQLLRTLNGRIEPHERVWSRRSVHLRSVFGVELRLKLGKVLVRELFRVCTVCHGQVAYTMLDNIVEDHRAGLVRHATRASACG